MKPELSNDPLKKKETIAKIFMDLRNETRKEQRRFLKDEEYKERNPVVEEWEGAVTYTKGDETLFRLNLSQVYQIIDKQMPVADDIYNELREWYDSSIYRYKHDVEKAHIKYSLAQAKGRTEEMQKHWGTIETLTQEHESLTKKDIQMKELAYKYREKGERLEMLYDVLYGYQELIPVQFGSVTFNINKESYNENIMFKKYKESKGFLEDVASTYETMLELAAPLRFSKSTGLHYSNEYAQGGGKGKIEVNDKEIQLYAELHRDEINQILRCIITSDPIAIPLENVVEKKHIFLPEYAFAQCLVSISNDKGEEIHSVYYEWEFPKELHAGYLMHDRIFNFTGNPERFPEEIPRVLEALLE